MLFSSVRFESVLVSAGCVAAGAGGFAAAAETGGDSVRGEYVDMGGVAFGETELEVDGGVLLGVE